MNKLNVVGYVKGVMGNIPRAGKLPWTPRAQAVLEEAQKKAREDGVGLLGSEHILFGIMSVEECLGATILGSLGVTPSTLSDRYERSSKPSARKEAGEGKPSEHIDRLIQCAAEQAAQWGHEYIGAEHLLAGILLAGTGLGFQILTDLDITLEKVRQETAKLVVCRPAPGQ